MRYQIIMIGVAVAISRLIGAASNGCSSANVVYWAKPEMMRPPTRPASREIANREAASPAHARSSAREAAGLRRVWRR